MTDPDLLRAAARASGLPMSRWIRERLLPACGARPPHERTVYRWLSGDLVMQDGVRRVVERMVKRAEKQRV